MTIPVSDQRSYRGEGRPDPEELLHHYHLCEWEEAADGFIGETGDIEQHLLKVYIFSDTSEVEHMAICRGIEEEDALDQTSGRGAVWWLRGTISTGCNVRRM